MEQFRNASCPFKHFPSFCGCKSILNVRVLSSLLFILAVANALEFARFAMKPRISFSFLATFHRLQNCIAAQRYFYKEHTACVNL